MLKCKKLRLQNRRDYLETSLCRVYRALLRGHLWGNMRWKRVDLRTCGSNGSSLILRARATSAQRRALLRSKDSSITSMEMERSLGIEGTGIESRGTKRNKLQRFEPRRRKPRGGKGAQWGELVLVLQSILLIFFSCGNVSADKTRSKTNITSEDPWEDVFVEISSLVDYGYIAISLAGSTIVAENRAHVGGIAFDRYSVSSDDYTCPSTLSHSDEYFATGSSTEFFTTGFCQWSSRYGLARRFNISSWQTWNSAWYVSLETFSDPFCTSDALLSLSTNNGRLGPLYHPSTSSDAVYGVENTYVESRSSTLCWSDLISDSVVVADAQLRVLFSSAESAVLLPPAAKIIVSSYDGDTSGRRLRNYPDEQRGLLAVCEESSSPTQVAYTPAYNVSGSCQVIENNNGDDVYLLVQCSRNSSSSTSDDEYYPSSHALYSDADCSNIISSVNITELSDDNSSSCVDLVVNDTLRLQVSCVSFHDTAITSSPTTLSIVPTSPTAQPTRSPTSVPVIGVSLGVVLPVLALLAVSVYVLITRRKKKKNQTDDASEFSEAMPKGKRVSRRGTLNLLGVSMTMLRVSDSKGGDRDRAEDEETDPDNAAQQILMDESYVVADVNSLRLGNTLGRGTHGRVYAGTFQGSSVAVKDFSTSQRIVESRKAFLAEAESLRALQHPNITRLYGIVVAGGRHQLILERAEHSLADLVERKGALQSGLTIVTILQWAEQICVGGAFMHSKHIAHMDLKPSNILLDHAWNVKISDFGSSCNFEELCDRRSQQAQAPGSLAFMPPERFDSNHHLDSSVDIYAFGMTFWQMLERAEPFPSRWTTPVIMEKVQGGFRPDLDPLAPDSLHSFLAAAWDSQASNRPSFQDLKDALSEILGTRTIDARGQAYLARRAPFERGQDVSVWAPEKMCFTGHGRILENARSPEGSFMVELEDSIHSRISVPSTELL